MCSIVLILYSLGHCNCRLVRCPRRRRLLGPRYGKPLELLWKILGAEHGCERGKVKSILATAIVLAGVLHLVAQATYIV